ncbi:sensor histidine kinase [Deinococcus hopiensis]|uniref:histidine kinase n=1 Tax=Deinococcus hopiensis KR-140 TaxID=695939 RepID=A0A1W1UW26_9DEIO|nr:GAF domain-containing protein [Deinococcus hopiensis]SMB85307.1 Bacteriophytochrome (light-regulated signal transduction histidine kinase) [Deinococcus hopiensis KR-140]
MTTPPTPLTAQALGERLQHITEVLAAANTQDMVFEAVLHPALDALRASTATVLLADREGQRLEREALLGYPEGDASIWQSALVEDDGPAAEALRIGGALFFPEVQDLVKKYPNLEARMGATAPVAATAVLPMFLDRRPLGVIVLDFQEPHHFTLEEQRFVRILAAQCAIAFGRVRLLQNLEGQVTARTRELEAQKVVLETQQVTMTEQAHALQSANEELDVFTLSVSHDLRAPVRHMRGFLSLLKREVEGQLTGKAARYFQVVEDTAGRMDTMIEALLQLSRTSHQDMRVGPVNVERLIENLRSELQGEAADRDITWVIHPIPVVMADEALLRQVLMNLLSNAMKYTRQREGTRIEVWGEERPDGWVMEVRDNGVGFIDLG